MSVLFGGAGPPLATPRRRMRAVVELEDGVRVVLERDFEASSPELAFARLGSWVARTFGGSGAEPRIVEVSIQL